MGNERKSRKLWELNNPWNKHLAKAKMRCSRRNGEYSYLIRGIKCILTNEEIKKLWFKSGADKMKRPVLHRKDNDLDYAFDTCVFIEKDEHNAIHKLQNKSYKQLFLDRIYK